MRHSLKQSTGESGGSSGGATDAIPTIPAFLKDFKALDALATSGAGSRDTRPTPCPLCGRSCGGQRGLRMHLVGAHPLDISDRDHLVRLLEQGRDSSLELGSNRPSVDKNSDNSDVRLGVDSDTPTVGAGAAARGRAGDELPPGFAAARTGDMVTLRGLVEVGWDPATAVDKNGSSPLDWAAGEGRLDACRRGDKNARPSTNLLHWVISVLA